MKKRLAGFDEYVIFEKDVVKDVQLLQKIKAKLDSTKNMIYRNTSLDVDIL